MVIWICVDADNYPIRAFSSLASAKAYRNGIFKVIESVLHD